MRIERIPGNGVKFLIRLELHFPLTYWVDIIISSRLFCSRRMSTAKVQVGVHRCPFLFSDLFLWSYSYIAF